jgi:hypothetical protein
MLVCSSYPNAPPFGSQYYLLPLVIYGVQNYTFFGPTEQKLSEPKLQSTIKTLAGPVALKKIFSFFFQLNT